jgi:DNA-3-methyladenine glycosylase
LTESQPLPRTFFARSPDEVARALVGKLLLRRLDGVLLAGRVVETEAYFGMDDAAAHAAAGRTERNAVLWGPPGHAYVYLSYGMHWCLNVSCEPEGQAGCVLFRALEPVAGVETMRELRGGGMALSKLAAGPGRLCAAMAITRPGCNGLDMTAADSPLLLAEDGTLAPEVVATARVGITKAADRLLRFVAAGSRFASRTR